MKNEKDFKILTKNHQNKNIHIYFLEFQSKYQLKRSNYHYENSVQLKYYAI